MPPISAWLDEDGRPRYHVVRLKPIDRRRHRVGGVVEPVGEVERQRRRHDDKQQHVVHASDDAR